MKSTASEPGLSYTVFMAIHPLQQFHKLLSHSRPCVYNFLVSECSMFSVLKPAYFISAHMNIYLYH